MKMPTWLRVLYWLVLVVALGLFLLRRLGPALAGSATTVDALIFVVWMALLLSPLFSEVGLLGVKLKQAIKEAKEEIKAEVTSLRSDVAAIVGASASVNQHFHMSTVTGQVDPAHTTSKPRQPLEYKILNTLWTQQVNRFPDKDQLFTFRINATSPEFLEFREAGNKLLGEGLIGETDAGQFYLTPAGFKYCKEHYSQFPPDQWWAEPLDSEKLQRALAAA